MQDKKSLLLIIDGNALVHRAYHALPPLTSLKTGEMLGAVYGFSMMLIKAINELKPTHCAMAFDMKAPTFRHAINDQYKAHRPATPNELVSQLGRVRQVVKAFSIPIFEMEGFEADDILGALASQASQQGIDVVILTGDADMMQLVTPKIKVYYPRPGGSFSDAILYDEEAVKQKYGVTPTQIADLKALKGDPSDNIQGVPGVGDKTALKLILQFGSVEYLLNHLDEIEPVKLREKIKENLSTLKQSHILATIDKQTPVVLDFDKCCQLSKYDRNRVVELFRDLNFNTLLAKLPVSEVEPLTQMPPKIESEKPEIVYQTINTLEELELLISTFRDTDFLAISTTGSNLSPMSARITGISISPRAGIAYYIPITSSDIVSSDQTLIDPMLNTLRPILENQTNKIIHNSKYDLILLAEKNIKLNNLTFDTMLAGYLLGDKSLSLKDVVFNRTGIEMTPSSSLTGTGSKQIPLFQVELEEVSNYACANADMAARLAPILKKELLEQDLWELYDQVELPLVPILAHMERCGVLLDTGLLREMSDRLGGQLEIIEKSIYEIAEHAFNINSPQQLGVVLFDELHLPGKKVKGKYSTDASILEELREYPIIRALMEYRQLMKLKSTYIDALPSLINARTGRVHTSFNQMRTSTGRLSSSDPNLQNIPVRGELGREIRKAFIAPPGHVLMAGDYSQIDLRALAHLSQDENLVTAFRENRDIHSATASQLFGIEIENVNADMRRLAKTVNFGVIYGMSEFGLEQATELSRQDAGKFIKAYFEKYPGVLRYLEHTKEQAHQRGYVQTILKRRRYIPEINSANRILRESAERMAINMPVQGTSSDIIKVAMINLYREMCNRKLQSRMLLQVHDELIFEVPLKEVEEMIQILREKMVTAVQLCVPLKVDIKSGLNWGAME